MTRLQQTRFYFPRWHRAFAANWQRIDGIIAQKSEHPVSKYFEAVSTIANRMAVLDHRAVTDGDLRHACHIVALGKDTSSHTLTNQQVDRVVCLFDLLANPDDLAATMKWDGKDSHDRRRLEFAIRNCGMDDAYIRQICRAKFGTNRMEGLNELQLKQLLITLKSRAKSRAETLAEFAHV